MTADPRDSNFFALRAYVIKNLERFYTGGDIGPVGQDQKRFILPQILTQNCWDTHPRGWQFSEYGNDAGMTEGE